MHHVLGDFILSIELNAGLFGKKPTAIDVYAAGLVLKYKGEDKTYSFGEISVISVYDYFVPNPREYSIDLLDKSNKKIASIAIPYARYSEVTALLEAHMHWNLGADFPQNLLELTIPLDTHVRWQRGTLIHEGRGGITKYSTAQISAFVEHKGTYTFTFKDSKDTLMVSPVFSPNCLTMLAVCRGIAALL